MKSNIKAFVSGVLVTGILMLSIPALAAGLGKTIKVVLNAVTVQIDGKSVGGDKISYNNNVYVNVKNVAELVGKGYKIDKNGNISFQLKSVPVPEPESTSKLASEPDPEPVYKDVYNYDFEADPNANGWFIVSSSEKSQISASWLDSNFHSAYHAIKVTGNDSSGNLKKVLPIEQNKTYKLSVWNTSENITVKDGESGAFIAIAQLDSNGDIISSTQKSINWSNKHEWVQYNISNIKAVNGAVKIGIYMGLNGSGTVWFDDVCLQEASRN